MSSKKSFSMRRSDSTAQCLEKYQNALAHGKCLWHRLYKECPRISSICSQNGSFHTDIIANWLCPEDQIKNNPIFSMFISKIKKLDRNDYTRISGAREEARPPRTHERVNNYERFIEKHILNDYQTFGNSITVTLYNSSFNQLQQVDDLGCICNIEIPLEEENDNKRDQGAIDLVAHDHEKLYLCELKRSLSEESILRCVLEVFTYAMTILDAEKFCRQMGAPKTKIVLCPLIFVGSSTYKDFLRLKHLPETSPFNRLIKNIIACGFDINFATIDPATVSPGIRDWIDLEQHNQNSKA